MNLKTFLHSHYQKNFPQRQFVPGVTAIPVSGKVFDERELLLGVEAVLDGWWTEGRFAEAFEKEFTKLCGCRYVSLVNSGSSANLVALSSLTSPSLKQRALQPGDEIIALAASFPTTVNPIIQNKLVPVFIDVDLTTKNVDLDLLKKAIGPKTKGIMMAHALGNPMPVKEMKQIAEQHGLWLIEDCCDALGATYGGKPVGTFGDIATYSFYPAHQMTMGEGGAVVTNNSLLFRSIRQFRDWGRDCWCKTGKDNTCAKRFGWKLGNLPFGYDHKYIYSQIGYNLKLTDMQAAIGLAQLKKVKGFVRRRNNTFNYYKNALSKYSHIITFSEQLPLAKPSWFGFMILVSPTAPFTSFNLIEYLEQRKIGTRRLFAGNLLRHPAYIRSTYKTVGTFQNTDRIMNDGFWIGVYPGITNEMRHYVAETIIEYLKNGT